MEMWYVTIGQVNKPFIEIWRFGELFTKDMVEESFDVLSSEGYYAPYQCGEAILVNCYGEGHAIVDTTNRYIIGDSTDSVLMFSVLQQLSSRIVVSIRTFGTFWHPEENNISQIGNTSIMNGMESTKSVEENANFDSQGMPPVAVIGMAMRLPGGIRSGTEFWQFLVDGKEARCKIPATRYNVEAFHAPGHIDGVKTEYGFFLDEASLKEMDTSPWSMTKREVEELDPQQRLALQIAFECLENSGTTKWRGTDIGTYFGAFGEDWHDLHHKETLHQDMYSAMTNSDFFISNRVAYELDLKGPSVTLRTACSSSLAALHAACGALRNGDCSSAIVGGVNLILSPEMTIDMSKQGIISPGARCKTFDATADGYARGEACVAVHIKPLHAALRDGDPVRSIIRSVTLNHDGKTSGIFSPNSESHVSLMKRAHILAGITESDWWTTAMIECHGTGTAVGDPAEANAVAQIFGEHGIYIGSVKPNLGHSEGASGITSLIKSTLALEHETIPPNRNFSTPNPKISWNSGKLNVPVKPVQWPNDRARRIGINNFGIGGSNAHVLLESATPSINPVAQPGRCFSQRLYQILIFYAASSEALNVKIEQHLRYLVDRPGRLQDLSYTLNQRREILEYRAYRILDCSSESVVSKHHNVSKPPKQDTVIFAFTGQGAQWPEMGRSLIKNDIHFRECIEELDRMLQECRHPPQWSLLNEILQPDKNSKLYSAEYSQPCCTAIQIALVDGLIRSGVRPSAVVGHSSGEIAAAYAAGGLSKRNAIYVAYTRGLATKEIPASLKGGMVAVGLSSEVVESFLNGTSVIIACENSPESITLSGDLKELDKIVKDIQNAHPEAKMRKLKVNHAYHSKHMESISAIYRDLLDKIGSKGPDLPFASAVYGTMLDADRQFLDESYWQNNLVRPVKFLSAVTSLLNLDGFQCSIILEIGPHNALAGPLRQISRSLDNKAPHCVPTLVRNQDAELSLLESLGELFMLGMKIDWDGFTSAGKCLTDLPPYPWQPTGMFWKENRLSREWRFRRYKHHELLGSKMTTSSHFDATWRNILSLDDVPWLRDHVVDKDIVFPGACYLAMIGVALAQLIDQPNCGYRVRGVTFANALILHEGQTFEIITHMNKLRLDNTSESTWFEWTISSYNGNKWIKHTNGQVRSINLPVVERVTADTISRTVLPKTWYAALPKYGLEYKECFQKLSTIRADVNQTVATAKISSDGIAELETYVIHPIVIDNTLQLVALASCKGLVRNLCHLFVPTYLGDASFFAHQETPSVLDAYARSQKSMSGALTGKVIAHTEDGRAVMTMNRLKFFNLNEGRNVRGDDPHAAAQLVWQEDADLLDDLSSLFSTSKDIKKSCEPVDEMALACILEAQHQLIDQIPQREHLRKFCDWINYAAEKAAEGMFLQVKRWREILSMTSSERQDLIETHVRETKSGDVSALSTCIYRVFQKLKDIVSGQIDVLDVLMKDSVLEELYSMLNSVNVDEFFKLESHMRPNLKILEIGAGTGGFTGTILSGLASENADRGYHSYTFTDISPGFFPAAKKKFKNFPALHYKVLDISKDPISQGFDESNFDIVVAANVLHATPTLVDTLRNVRKLLAPNGKLLLQELCHPSKSLNFIMGGLEGWWLGSNDGRCLEPYISPSEWEIRLREAGFDGIRSTFIDGLYYANMICTPMLDSSSDKKVTFLADGHSPEVNKLKAEFEGQGYVVTICKLYEISNVDQDIIVLLDIERPFLYSMSATEYQSLQKLIMSVSLNAGPGLLWITQCWQRHCRDPRYGLVGGFSRTVRTELGINFATLEIRSLQDIDCKSIFKVFRKFHSRQTHDFNTPKTLEWMALDNVIQCSRFSRRSVENALKDFNVSRDAIKLGVGETGFIDSLIWKRHTLGSPEREELQIRVDAIGLNFKDLLIIQGIIDDAEIGSEFAGTVIQLGPNATDFKIGDRVLGFATGTFASKINVSERICAPIPDHLSFEDAATIPTVFSTAVYSLYDVARMKRGMSILIHSACGGVGLAAVQLCQSLDAEIFCTVGTEEKKDFLTSNMKIPREHIFCSHEESFLEGIMQATNGKGVDIVLNSLSGELLKQSWSCVAEFGTMIELGKKDLLGEALLPLAPFEHNRSYIGVDLAHILQRKPAIIQDLIARIVGFSKLGIVSPITPNQVFQASDIEKALRLLQTGQHIGKLIIKMPEDSETLNAVVLDRTELTLSEEGSYLFVGGLGGLGRAISIWMAEHGAGEIIFLSRSAHAHSKMDFTAELNDLGCRSVLVNGSVLEKKDIEKALNQASFPVRGVIQGAMVLKGSNFLDMPFSDWQATISPKVQGSQNIHECLQHLEDKIDFFITMSSVVGVLGWPGLADYAAANTFLDSFAEWRKTKGLSASSIAIGVMGDIGFVSEHEDMRRLFEQVGFDTIGEKDLLDALELQILTSKHSMAAEEPLLGSAVLPIGIRSKLPLASEKNHIFWKHDIRCAAYFNMDSMEESGITSAEDDVKAFLERCKTEPSTLNEPETEGFIAEKIADTLAGFLIKDRDSFRLEDSIQAIGLDSLVGIELRNWFKQTLHVDFSIAEIRNTTSIQELGKHVVTLLKHKYVDKSS